MGRPDKLSLVEFRGILVERASPFATLVAVLVLTSPSATVYGHGGGLNASGCHHDRKAGGYHCHGSAAPAWTPSTSGSYRPPPPLNSESTDDEVRKAIVRESIRAYPRNCACPFNTDSGGRLCGKRSAYQLDEAAGVLCYATDIPAAMVEAYRDKHSLRPV